MVPVVRGVAAVGLMPGIAAAHGDGVGWSVVAGQAVAANGSMLAAGMPHTGGGAGRSVGRRGGRRAKDSLVATRNRAGRIDGRDRAKSPRQTLAW